MKDDHKDWLFDEATHVGVDYSDFDVVVDYDNQHEGFRDFEAEADKIASAISLSPKSIVLDIGCGTGGLSICLARKSKHVYAVDVSQVMVDVLKSKRKSQRLRNITPLQSGFLTYQHEGESPDAIIANITLHHLPDFWKQIALCRLHDLLKPGGKMFLADVVFTFNPRDYQETIDGWLDGMRELAGEKIADETVVHVRDEFSTWDWVMKGMIERAGFQLDQELDIMPQMRAYICRKPE
ncbi:MAG: class I SAM-dependent methyltransferase [Candidatus Electrothrix sp. AX2]|nr:class I SAM-dependent methyltransferase [Candidatus Electrothrix gigas]